MKPLLKYILSLWALWIATFVASLAFAADAASLPASLPVDDAPGLFSYVVSAFKAGYFAPAAAGVLTLLVYILTKTPVMKFLPVKALPWVSLGAGVAAAVATNLLAQMPWYAAVIQGLTSGAAATGLWEAVFKYVLPKKDETA